MESEGEREMRERENIERGRGSSSNFYSKYH